MKPKPNSVDDSPTPKVSETAPSYPAPVDLSPVSDADELPEHAEPSLTQQLRHACMLLQIDPRTSEQRLEERRKMMNHERFTM